MSLRPFSRPPENLWVLCPCGGLRSMSAILPIFYLQLPLNYHCPEKRIQNCTNVTLKVTRTKDILNRSIGSIVLVKLLGSQKFH